LRYRISSPYSVFLNVPVPVWGIVGYLVFILLLLAIWRLDENRSRLWPTLSFIAFCFSLYSIVLAFISTFYIRSYCIMCIASYAVNLLLLYFSWLTYKRFDHRPILIGLKNDFNWLLGQKLFSIISLTMLAVVFVGLVAFFPPYWEFKAAPLNEHVPTGTTADGHPWIGAQNPEITIIEFTDYRCFQCKKMHFFLRQLITNYPGKIRLVHRNFPMDHAYNPLVKEPFHVGSGKMALFSLFAAEKKTFWEFSDMLFNVDTSTGNFNLRGMARTAGFDVAELAGAVNDKRLLRKLRIDIRDGLKRGITGTPGYVVDGEVYLGNIPAEVFQGCQGVTVRQSHMGLRTDDRSQNADNF
jgi:protein-disulfide isomerase